MMNPPTSQAHQVDGTLSILNYPPTRLPGPSLLHQLVTQPSPETAIDFLGDGNRQVSLSYTQLHYASDALAATIQATVGSLDDSKQFVVPVLLTQGPLLYISLLAILKAGGAFCPLNLDLPLERAQFILEDVEAKVVITTPDLAKQLPPAGEPGLVVLLVGEEGPPRPPENEVKRRQPSPHDLAYVMYTSGSTGTPKGVGVSHEAATQSLLAHDRHIPSFSRFLQFAAPTFDVSVFEIFFPLFRAKTLVSCTRSAMLDNLPGVIRRMSVDACELTPSVAGSLLRKRDSAPCLRLLLTIGEMLTKPVVEEFGGHDGQPSMLWGMYGPTEAAIHCTVQPSFACSMSTANIGVPFDTVSAFVLQLADTKGTSPDFRVLARGEVGELAVGGPQVATVYVNRPEMTAKAFIETPYGRLYRTGDKARILPDGSLECLGRIGGGQVKLRGQRMELGEVEHAALRAAGCHSAVAAVINSILVLFCAVDQTDGMTDAIEVACNSWLPGFMLPGDIVVMDAFPLLPSGKADRKGLIAGYTNPPAGPGATSRAAFKDELEQKLCSLAMTALGVQVQPDQPLQQAGLDSLTAIRLASLIREAGFPVSAIEVLNSRTIVALYAHVSKKAHDNRLASDFQHPGPSCWKVDIPELLSQKHSLFKDFGSVESVHPCTPLQTSMLAETAANPAAYCNWIKLRFPIACSEAAISSWFLQLVEKNEILRTGFYHHNGQFLQVVFQQLNESCISSSGSSAHEFELRDDRDFLTPFRVHILEPEKLREPRDGNVVVQLHHALYDGWSWDLILADLSALMQGKQPHERPQFSRIAHYYASPFFNGTSDAAKEFWGETLRGFQPPALPILRAETTPLSTVSTCLINVDIRPDELKTALNDIQCGAQTVFQASVAWLWSAMVGSEDVVVGTVTSGRTLPISLIEDVIGPCIAALPLRTDFSRVRSIKDLLSSIQGANRAILEHSILPLSEIKRAAGVRPGQAIYNVLLVYQQSLYSGQGGYLGGVEEVDHQDFLETPLLVEVEPRAHDFVVRITSLDNTIPDQQIRTLASCINQLASWMFRNFDSKISEIQTAFSPPALSIFNPKPITFGGVPDLAHAVDVVVAKTPNKEALCFAEQISDSAIRTTTLSFVQLNETANQIGSHLKDRGLEEGGVVAIVMEKSVLLYAGILAILKAGCAYLPLLPSTPKARIGTILRQAGVTFCLTDNSTGEQVLQEIPLTLVDLDELDYASLPSSPIVPRPDPERLAYVIYTSGSTGVPKGVCITQLNIVSNLDVLSRLYPVKDHSRLLQSCSQAFDVSVFEIFFAWTQGMCLCSGNNDTLFEDLERSIRKLDVTHLSMTPTVASLVDPAKVPAVEFLVTAGEAMTELVAKKWGGKLYQGYGPSETTNICSVKKMGPNQAIQHLGWSFENTSTFVLFRDSYDIAPLGCLGEFCFGGDQVAEGYLDMPALTSAKFINHPTLGRLYRSGDIGRMLSDGSMVILGRLDEQIKLRGQRVELGEITAMLRLSGAVKDCVSLFLRRDSEEDRDLIVSYFVPRGRQRGDYSVLELDEDLKSEVRSLFRLLTSRVPMYMVPSAIVPISVLPTTASGKLDRTRLTACYRQLSQRYLAAVTAQADEEEAPGEWTETEQRVAGVVSDALNVPRHEVQRWTPLGTLGLDSISAIQVVKSLYAHLGHRIPISVILQNPNIARLAKILSDLGPTKSLVPKTLDLLPMSLLAPLKAKLSEQGASTQDALPCTPLQQGMLAATASKNTYINRMLFLVSADPARLEKAWYTMISRHGILRTCFMTTHDSRHPIVQVVLDGWRPKWLNFDASTTPIDQCVAEQIALLGEALDSLQPMISLAWVQRKDQRILSFVCHHALYDGVAIEHLLYEVEQVYHGLLLPPAPSYAAFLQESSCLPEATDRFWADHLSGIGPKLLTELIDGSKGEGMMAKTQPLQLRLSDIREKIRELGISLLALVQTSWAITLGCVLRTDDVCFGNVVNGRSVSLEGINELVAPCFNTLPVRIDFSEAQQILELIKRVQRASTKALEFQFTPLRHINSLFSQSQARRLFDTLLLLQHTPRPLDNVIWKLEQDDGDMDVPLICEVVPDATRDEVVIKMHAQSVPSEIHQLILDLFIYCVETCLQYPAARILTPDGLPKQFRERLDAIPRLQPPTSATAAVQVEDETEESWDAAETAIRRVLAELSSSDEGQVRKTTTIYQLGLDSIGAVQVASMLRQTGYHVHASDVIATPTCQGLAHRITHEAEAKVDKSRYDFVSFHSQVQPQLISRGVFVPRTVDMILPCTPLQASMMAQFITSGGQDYFNYLAFRFDGLIEVAKIERAWEAVCVAHPILRTGLAPVEHKDCAFAMIQYDCRSFAPKIEIVNGSGAVSSLDQWRSRARQRVVQVPHERLFAVALVQNTDGMTMHLAIHHALYDAYSLHLIMSDISKALLHGLNIATLNDTEEVVADIMGQLSTSSNRIEGFWKQKAQQVVVNPFPVMTPLRQASREMMTEWWTSKATRAELERAVKDAGFSLQAVLQAAWTRVLSSYLGEPSVVFGVVLSGRNSEATRNAVFPCIGTLPIIATNAESNHELLTQMMQYNAEIFSHQHQPLTKIQNWLGHADSRLFDTLLVYQKFDIDDTEITSWRVVEDRANINYPISVEVEPEMGGGLKYRVTFFSDVLPREQAQILLRQFDAAVYHLAFGPDKHESDLFSDAPDIFSVLPPDKAELPTEVRFLHQFVERQSIETPEVTALSFVEAFQGGVPIEKSWTYKELNENGNRVGQMLAPYVNVGEIVAVYFDKCPEAYFSILGILKAGCAFVALDPGAPATRNEFILRDSGASALLTTNERRSDLGFNTTVRVFSINTADLPLMPSNHVVPSSPLEPSNVCYCLYTSGTTGTPKGCEITHDNAVQCMLAFRHIFKGKWDSDSRWLQFASLHFDVSVLEQYWSWSVGITLVAAPRDVILEDLSGTISRLGITHIDLTPSLARLVHPDDVPSLCRGVFITGGESLKQEILDVWGEKRVIYNFYGPTEATIGVTVYPQVPVNGRASNIGKQFINVGSFVLKPGTDLPVMRGAVGELCVSGRLVGKGYLKRQDLTAERFLLLQPFGERIYRTGDLVRLLHDGCFDFLGRADDQVKLRGQRLEIGEINHAIRKGVSEIRDVATLVVRNESQQKDLLVSFVMGENGSKSRNQELTLMEGSQAAELCQRARDACRSRLPGYMVPTYVLQVPFIPLSANNKAEIKRLKQLFASIEHERLISLASSAERSRGELSPLGVQIAGAIAAMQNIDAKTIKPNSSIFELGIDSISVLRLSRSLREKNLLHATPATILKNPLIGDLSKTLAVASKKASPGAESVASARQLVQGCSHRFRSLVCKELLVSPDDIQYIAPCSPLQEGMLSRSSDDFYFNTFRFNLAPTVKPETLQRALERTVELFPILRTKFVQTTDGFIQVALKKVKLPWNTMFLDSDKQQHRLNTPRLGSLDIPSLDISNPTLETGATSVLMDPPAQLIEGSSLPMWRTSHDKEDASLSSDGHPPISEESVTEAVMRWRKSWIDRNKNCLIQPFEVAYLDNPRHLALHIFHSLYDANSLQLILDRIVSEYHVLAQGSTATPAASAPSFVEALCYGPLQDFTSSKPFWVQHLQGFIYRPSPTGSNKTAVSIRSEFFFGDLEPLRTTLQVTHQAVVQAAWVGVLAKKLEMNPTIGMIVSGRAIDLEGPEKVVGPLFNTLPFHARLSSSERGPTTWASFIQDCHDFNASVLDFQHVPLRDIQKWCAGGRPLFDTLFSFQLQGESPTERRSILWEEVEMEPTPDYPLALEATLGSDGKMRLLLVSQQGAFDHESLVGLMDDLQGALTIMPRKLDENIIAGTLTFNSRLNTLVQDRAVADCHDAELTSSFTWTKDASRLRQEITELAETPVGLVKENVPVFELGLDSIDMIKLSARLKRNHGLLLTTSDLMKAQTIQGMVKLLHSRIDYMDSDADAEVTSEVQVLQDLTECVGESALPPTPLQEAMVADMIGSDFHLYFNHDICRLSPGVDADRLKAAWRTVVQQSDTLRSVFKPVEGSQFDFAYCQIPKPDFQGDLIFEVKLSSMDELARVSEAARLRARDGCGGTDLVQVTFVTMDKSDERFVVLSISHALYDGWSLGLLHQDVHAVYHGNPRVSTEIDRNDLLSQLLLPDKSKASTFWAGFLEGASCTMLPLTTLSGQQRTHLAESTSACAASNITEFCKSIGVTLQILGQACWAALLASRTGSLDVTFGVIISGRDSEQLEKAMFPTMNTVAVRSVLHGTVSSWLRYMQDNMINIQPFQHFGLRQAQKVARSNGPLFNSLFIQQQQPLAASGKADDLLWVSVGGESAVEYPVCVEMEMSGAGLIWRTACDGAHLSREDADGLVNQLDITLQHIVQSADQSVLAFSGQKMTICGLPLTEFEHVQQRDDESGHDVDSEKPGDAVWGSAESMIREVLADVSGIPVESILMNHSIYNLGLDSITAVKASSALQKRGIKIRFRDLLRAKSISEMATMLHHDPPLGAVNEIGLEKELSLLDGLDVSDILSAAGLDPSTVESVLPATSMQVHMLSVWQNTQGAIFYPDFRYELVGDVDLQSIIRAWGTLVTEIPILRTIFLPTGVRDVPILQVIVDHSHVELTSPSSPTPKSRRWLTKLKDRLSPESTAWSSQALEQQTGQPFSRLEVKRCGKKWTLTFKMHHAMYDAISLSVILSRFCAILSGVEAKPHVSQNTWKTALTAEYASKSKKAKEQFWREYLAGVTSTPLILNRAATTRAQSTPPKRRMFQDITNLSGTWSSQASQQIPWTKFVQKDAFPTVGLLVQRCMSRGISLQSLFLAAYAQFVASKTEQRDVVFGIYLANRSGHDELLNPPYPTLRLVPVRVRFQVGEAKLLDVATRIQNDIHVISSDTNATVGLWDLEDWAGVTIDSFVNFLGSPADNKVLSPPVGEVQLIANPSLEERKHAPRRGIEGMKIMESNAVRGSYPATIDVEVSVTGEAMTIGLFGPGDKVGPREASSAIEDIVEILKRLLVE
ncbi:putative peptide synthetase [Triangularia verruculosa]|uniref:Peptide synthetase n=1 Tax=Triangularia verruculosa TaxID=2587418 RepID=A0AAN6XDL1_9PEZI|nr:putative peptide synthetase [Triangularia verruculosa]